MIAYGILVDIDYYLLKIQVIKPNPDFLGHPVGEKFFLLEGFQIFFWDPQRCSHALIHKMRQVIATVKKT